MSSGRLRGFNRFRWLHKCRLFLRDSNGAVGFADILYYILWDPEVHTYSYDIVVDAEYLAEVDVVVGDPRSVSVASAQVALTFDQIAQEIPAITRWRWESKRKPSLGRHFTTCLLAAHFMPTDIVEIGTHHGMGALCLHRTLESVSREPFRVVSIDYKADNGWLPATQRLSSWTMVVADAVVGTAEFEPSGRGPILVVLDATPNDHLTLSQISNILEATPDRTRIFVGNAAWNDAVRTIAETRGGVYGQVVERAKDHWTDGRRIDIAVIPNDTDVRNMVM